MQKRSLFLKVLFVNSFILFTFVTGTVRASAQQEALWYVNPQSATCVQVPNLEYVLTPEDIAAGYVGVYETCTDGSSGDSTGPVTCIYEKCTAPTNANDNPNGATASFAASINKATYSPGERGQLRAVGALGSIPQNGSLQQVLSFFSFEINIFNGLICFLSGFFNSGCRPPRTVYIYATLPNRDVNLTDIYDCPMTDPDGYGFVQLSSWYNGDQMRWCYWDSHRARFDKNSEPRLGRFVTGETEGFFTAPRTPGPHSMMLEACHEKDGCAILVFLNFTVGPAAAPTVNLFFSELFEKIRNYFKVM